MNQTTKNNLVEQYEFVTDRSLRHRGEKTEIWHNGVRIAEVVYFMGANKFGLRSLGETLTPTNTCRSVLIKDISMNKVLRTLEEHIKEDAKTKGIKYTIVYREKN